MDHEDELFIFVLDIEPITSNIHAGLIHVSYIINIDIDSVYEFIEFDCYCPFHGVVRSLCYRRGLLDLEDTNMPFESRGYYYV